jgi:hypothetical protein
MAIDIHALYSQVAASQTLPDSVRLLVDGLAAELPQLRELVTHPDDPNRQLSAGALLAEALTRNTSHVAVDVRDEVGSLRANLLDRLERHPDKATKLAELDADVRRMRKVTP